MSDYSIVTRKNNGMGPLSMVRNLWVNRSLIWQFVKREVAARYRGSYLGIIWSFLNPIFMLVVYTFVFSVVFKARWPNAGGNQSKIEFALILFCGLTTFNICAEVLNRAPSLIISNVNYVKKVVFPLEILPVVAIGSALVQALISLSLLTLALIIFMHTLHWTIIFLPIVLLPLLLLLMGLGWLLSSLGTFLRDMGQIVMIAVQVLMFITPIFYSATSVPARFQWIIFISPINHVVDDMRRIFIWGQLPNWSILLLNVVLSACVAAIGYIWFQKTRGGFADVL